MTALAADRDPGYAGERTTQEIPVYAGEKIYGGAFVCIAVADGYAREADGTAGERLVGVNLGDYRNGSKTVDNSTGASAAKYVTVEGKGVWKAKIAAATIATVGLPVWISDDQTVTLTPGNVFAGYVKDYVDTTTVLVDITPAVSRVPTRKRITFTSNATVTGAVQSALEFSRKVAVKRWYMDVLTAPGGSDTATCTITDGTSTITATISAAAVHAEDEAVTTVFLADTDISVTFARSGSSAATATIVLEYEEL